MAIARFKDLCLDAGDPARLGAFWAAVLGGTWQAWRRSARPSWSRGDGTRAWTVMADPEGNEFCAFTQ